MSATKTQRYVRVKDLPEGTLSTGVHLYCPRCGDKWSATRGDYFMASPETIMRCANDKTPLKLTRTVSREQEV